MHVNKFDFNIKDHINRYQDFIIPSTKSVTDSIFCLGDAFPGLDAHKGEVAAMAQQRPFHPTLA